MAESPPSINLTKRKAANQGDSDLEDSDMRDLSFRDGTTETVRKRRKVESDNITQNPSSFGMLDEPSVQPGAPSREDAQARGGVQGRCAAPSHRIPAGTSEDIEMAESPPSINPTKRKVANKGDSELEDFDMRDSSFRDGTTETVRKRRKVELENVTWNPSSSGMLDKPLVQPGAPSREDTEQLEGSLIVPSQPIMFGGYADIYLGTWTSPEGTQADVAVKILKPIRPASMSCDLIALQQRREKHLRREGAIWTGLIHPNIHPLWGFRTQPEPCLINPWCHDGNLMNYVYNNCNLSRHEKIQLLVQIASGLAFLHSQSPPICHGDIKPENVLVNGLREAALSDFGLSRVIREVDASTGSTTGDGPKGTHRYMAPELLLEEDSKLVLETDVYAFGGLTLAVMSGSPPFAQIKRTGKIILRISTGEHPKPEEHPGLERNDALWSLMLRCWTREPQMRPIMSDVMVELKQRPDHNPAPAMKHPFAVLESPGAHGPATPQLTDEQAKLIIVEKAPRAHGSYSDVYKGSWTSPAGTNEAVAVKILRFTDNPKNTTEELRTLDVMFRRLAREVFIWQRLSHPRITPILGYTRTARRVDKNERPSIISPWREFGNLDKYIKKNPGVDRIALLIQAAEGVNVLHTFEPNPIVHLDVKPENFLVTENGEVELCDFGISRVLEDAPSGFTTGPGVGTLPFQAPEYLVDNERSTAVDVYAFGGVILKVLTGKVPFASLPQGRLVIEVAKGKKPNRREYQFNLPQAIADEVWKLMNKCWALTPTERPSMAVVIEQLNQIAANINASAN